MRMFCPNCRAVVEPVGDSKPESYTCPACGSTFIFDVALTLPAESEDTVAASLTPHVSLLVQCQTIGRFQIQSEVGRGGFGTVFKAYDSELRRTVAVKVPRHGGLVTDHERERFLREARNASQLHHPAIVPIFDLGESNGLSYIVSEFVEGATLAELLPRRKYSFAESAELIAAAADGLQCAHDKGVIHRDIKPSNIIIDSNGRPRLMDFGMARQAQTDATLTLDGEIIGTPGYMSPEQAAGKSHEVDRRSDVYSLGIILYELLTGERPFRGNAPMVIEQVLHDDPHNPRSLNNFIPADLETICLKAIDKEPDRRYQTARELGDDLRRWLHSEPIHARRIGALGRAYRWCRRNPSLAGMSGLALLLLIAVTVGLTAAWTWVASERREKREADARADGSVQETRRAYDQYYALVSDNRLLETPSIQPFLKEILQTATDRCQRFVSQYGDNPQLEAEVAATYIRLAQLHVAKGESEAAVVSTEEGANRVERLLARHASAEQLSPLLTGLYRFPQAVQARGAVPPSDPARSLAATTRCVAVWDRLGELLPGNANVEHDRAGMYFYLDLAHRAVGDKAGSLRSIEKSIEISSQLVKGHPDNQAYKRDLSQFYSISGDAYRFMERDLAKSLSQQERATQIDPTNPRPFARMAETLTNFIDPKLRDPARAVEYAAKAVAIEPRNPQYWRILGVAQYRAGKWRPALDSFDKSMFLQNGGEGLDWYYASMAHWRLGEKERARELFHKAEAWKEKERVDSTDIDGLDREAARLIAAKAARLERDARPGSTKTALSH